MRAGRLLRQRSHAVTVGILSVPVRTSAGCVEAILGLHVKRTGQPRDTGNGSTNAFARRAAIRNWFHATTPIARNTCRLESWI
jgi:hypothetical protein